MPHLDNAYDVAIVGYGPSGEVLAATLGAAGHKVLVVERWPQAYPLPRLTTLDGEVIRAVQATSVDIDKAFENTLVQEACHFVDAEGEAVMSVNFPGKLGGWSSRISMFQPDFEKAIADKVESMSNVELLRGWEATELWQDSNVAHLTIAPLGRATGADSTPARTVRARYVVGTDGARSFVRQALGLGMRDYDMHQRWLNFDAWHLKPLPARLMALRIFMDPERPHMYMPIGKRGLRMEFRVMEGESDEAVSDPKVAWEFMRRKYGIGPEDVKLMRQVVYHYRTRIADNWRVKRIFLAGDAAHTMPPYMGQGACSAIRDARNLGWKLNEVLSGRSADELLDDYQAEREPHVTALVLGSDRLSRIVNIVDKAAAEKRNSDMRQGGDAQPPSLPSLTTGVVHHEADGTIAGASGKFTPQGLLRRGDQQARGDDLLGNGFQLWCRREPSSSLGDAERAWLDKLGCSVAVFQQADSAHAVEDVEGVYVGYLDELGADFAIVRPDFYAFGAGNAGQLNEFVRELAQRLRAVGRPGPVTEE